MKQKSNGELIAQAACAAIGIIMFNTVPLWRQYTHGVVLEGFLRILWAANLSFVVQMAGSLTQVFFRQPRVATASQVLGAAAGLMSLIVFFAVFPLDFTMIGAAWANSVLKIVLIAGMGGAGLGLIVQTVQLAAGSPTSPSGSHQP